MTGEHETNAVLSTIAQYRPGDRLRFFTQQKGAIRRHYTGRVVGVDRDGCLLIVAYPPPRYGSDRAFRVRPSRIEGRDE